MKPNLSTEFALPVWLPDPIRLYLDHIGNGVPIRELARREGLNASTVMRKVRRCEMRREDPLIDEALASLGTEKAIPCKKDGAQMTLPIRLSSLQIDELKLAQEARRVLRRLAEPGAVLALSPDMEKAVVLRDLPDGTTARSGVVDRPVAQAFALKDWIASRKQSGRISTYEITPAGRAALRRLIDEGDTGRQGKPGLAEAAQPFADQHRIWGQRTVEERGSPRRVRHNLAESPVAAMGRRLDKDGKPFLEPELVRAGERLREDFELAQMGPRIAQNWERFLTGGDRGSFRADSGLAEGPSKARDRVGAAMRDLGPGLGDVALRVCCFLEGIEVAERRMGWAARSGKIVLRIALQRLKRHYDETYGKSGPLIG